MGAPETGLRLTFTVPGPPVPKARARVVTDENGTRGVTPSKTKAYEKHVGTLALAVRMYGSGWPDRPAWPWQDKAARFGIVVKLYLSGREGDGDNYFKSITDACNNVLWVDDRQIDDGRFVKVRCERGQERAEVEVWTL